MLLTLLFGGLLSPLCMWDWSEPSFVSVLHQSRVNAGPFIKRATKIPAPGGGEHEVQLNANNSEDLHDLQRMIGKTAAFVLDELGGLGRLPPKECTDGLISVHSIADAKLNDQEVISFPYLDSDGSDQYFYGLTAYVFPGISWAFICTDCAESTEDILIHELTHFYLSQCGVEPGEQDEEVCHGVVDEFRKLDT